MKVRLPTTWQFRDRSLSLGDRTRVMGVLNVTPDSFSDGGRYADPAAAVARGLALFEEGADVVDVGGESTRPGAMEVAPDEEIARVAPVIRGLRARTDRPLSVDTRKAEVARAALAAGADIVNDVSALGDPAMAGVVRESGAGLVLMHMRGEPRTMQQAPVYADVVGEVHAFLAERLGSAVAAGIAPDRIALDPGIGFGKTAEHNVALLASTDRLRAGGRPLLLGVSRKSLLGALAGRPVGERLAAGLAMVAYLAYRGVELVRVHDVRESFDVARVLDRMVAEETAHGVA